MFQRNKNIFKQNNANPFVKSYGRVLLLLILLLTVGFTKTYAQYSVSENDDSRIKWREIKTNRFSIVYPDCYERSAQRLAVALDTISWHVGRTLGTDAPHIPVLIHTNSSKSNGMLAWAPKRMEFWTNTPPTHYAYPWSWQLAIHEYRHACQMQALDKGITKTLGNIFGEHIVGAVSGLIVPLWFMEGDAVVAETAMSPTGRGQTPDFKMQTKAMLLEKGVPDFDKAKLGSRKDFVPNHYVFGYYLATYSRVLYGKDIFAELSQATAEGWWKGAWFTKTKQGKYKDKIVYGLLADTLLKVWTKEKADWLQEGDISVLKEISGEKETYSHYKNPIEIGEDSVLALQTSQFDLQTLVLITKEGVSRLKALPYLKHSYFDYNAGKILYTQDAINHRWEQQNRSDIIEYDVLKKRYKTLTSNEIFFNPVYNPKNSKLIAAIRTNRDDSQSLVVMSSDKNLLDSNAEVQKNKKLYTTSIATESEIAFSFPCWSKDGKSLYVIETSAEGKCIANYDIQTKERREITKPSFDDISRLQVRDSKLYFLKDVKGKYELVSVDLNNGSTCLETNTEYGVCSFSFADKQADNQNKEILLSTYNSDGFRVVKTTALNKNIDLSQENLEQLFVKQLREEENFCLNAETLATKDTSYESKPYSKIAHLFNFHSWAPLYLNLSKFDLGLGVCAASQNLLSTSVLHFGYKYNVRDVKHELYLNYTYSGLYPIFDFINNYKLRSISLNQGNEKQIKVWDEWASEINMSVPYSWSTRRSVNTIKFDADYSIRKLDNYNIEPEKRNQTFGLFGSVGVGLNLNMLSAQAENDLVPRIGEMFEVHYKRTLTKDVADYFAIASTSYIPFFGKNRSLELTLAYQKNSPDKYYFSEEIDLTKGVYDIFPKRFAGASLALHTPICYPNFKLGAFVYCKRIAVAPFYEIGSFDGKLLQSIGSDINFNIHVLRIMKGIELGVRLGYLPESKQMFHNFLFSINL